MTHPLSRRRVIGAGGTAAALAVALSPQASPAQAQVPPGGRTGELITLVTPVRIFDSRLASPAVGGGKLAAGNAVAVTVSAGTLGGSSATVAFVNCTITDTEGSGFLTISASDLSGELPPPQTSNINWSASGQTLANLVLTAVGGENAISVACGGNGRTHFIIDLQGYVPIP
jgi:hypothetical protein